MTAAEILDKILEHKKLNAKTFSELIGLERPQAIYDIQKGKTKSISQAMINKITSVFSDINKVWLLTGEGEMLKSEKPYSYGSQSNSTLKEPFATYSIHSQTIDKSSDLLANISRMIQTNERNSISISKMVDSADRDSRTIAQLVDLLYQNGVNIPEGLQDNGDIFENRNTDPTPYKKQ